MGEFSFDHLSPTEFEEFCYELLVAIGANKISWRKGSGLPTSPADGGRDLECDFIVPEIGGGHRVERWFVECKHQKAGVPPQKISAALTWASANKPDCLLLIASGFLSNPCKDLIEKHSQGNPGFRIRFWERKDCERLALSFPGLLQKYKIFEAPKIFERIHPAHAYFLRWPQFFTLSALFEILEQVGPERFRDSLSLAYSGIINPQFIEPTDDGQTIGELLDTPLTYSEFRRKCLQTAEFVAESFLVQAIMHSALSTSFHLADETDVARQLENWTSWIATYESAAQAGTHSKWDLERFRRIASDHIDQIPENLARGKAEYQEFCGSVLAPLLFTKRDTLDFISSSPIPPEHDSFKSDDDIPF